MERTNNFLQPITGQQRIGALHSPEHDGRRGHGAQQGGRQAAVQGQRAFGAHGHRHGFQEVATGGLDAAAAGSLNARLDRVHGIHDQPETGAGRRSRRHGHPSRFVAERGSRCRRRRLVVPIVQVSAARLVRQEEHVVTGHLPGHRRPESAVHASQPSLSRPHPGHHL